MLDDVVIRRAMTSAEVDAASARFDGPAQHGMWVLTEDTNAPALGAYQAAPQMLTWTFSAGG